MARVKARIKTFIRVVALVRVKVGAKETAGIGIWLLSMGTVSSNLVLPIREKFG